MLGGKSFPFWKGQFVRVWPCCLQVQQTVLLLDRVPFPEKVGLCGLV